MHAQIDGLDGTPLVRFALGSARNGFLGPSGKVVHSLIQHPWLVLCRTANHHACRIGLAEGAVDVLKTANITIDQQR